LIIYEKVTVKDNRPVLYSVENRILWPIKIYNHAYHFQQYGGARVAAVIRESRELVEKEFAIEQWKKKMIKIFGL
jgi:hypothetical protein